MIYHAQGRDGKTFQRASNAGVNFFLFRVKCVQILRCFVAKVSYVAILRFLGFLFGNFLNIAVKRGFFFIIT